MTHRSHVEAMWGTPAWQALIEDLSVDSLELAPLERRRGARRERARRPRLACRARRSSRALHRAPQRGFGDLRAARRGLACSARMRRSSTSIASRARLSTASASRAACSPARAARSPTRAASASSSSVGKRSRPSASRAMRMRCSAPRPTATSQQPSASDRITSRSVRTIWARRWPGFLRRNTCQVTQLAARARLGVEDDHLGDADLGARRRCAHVVLFVVTGDDFEAEARNDHLVAQLPDLLHATLRDPWEHVEIGRDATGRCKLHPVDELVGTDVRDVAALGKEPREHRSQELKHEALELALAHAVLLGIDRRVGDPLFPGPHHRWNRTRHACRAPSPVALIAPAGGSLGSAEVGQAQSQGSAAATRGPAARSRSQGASAGMKKKLASAGLPVMSARARARARGRGWSPRRAR